MMPQLLPKTVLYQAELHSDNALWLAPYIAARPGARKARAGLAWLGRDPL